MSYSFRLPDLGEGVMEGEVVEWHVRVGDCVDEDQPMVEVMTDKATVTIGAPVSGTISALRFSVGETATVGDELLVIQADGAAVVAPHNRAHRGDAQAGHGDAATTKTPRDSEGPAATAVGDIKEGLPGTGYFQRPPTANAAGVPTRPLATPAVRRLARERGIELSAIRGSGPGGRVLRGDLERESKPAQRPADEAGDIRTPFVGMRRKIAARLQEATRTAAHFTFVEEVDATSLIAARAEAPGLTFLPFIVKAAALALRAYPALNSYLDEAAGEIVTRAGVHVGVATATEHGLLVPVVRNADQRSVAEIAAEVERLAAGARDGTLAATELRGSTFTVTSLGKLGGLLATPVLNHPEVGILGVHRIKERPVVQNGAIVVGQVMNVSLSFDHRIIDGHLGARFAYDIIARLEDASGLDAGAPPATRG